MAELSDGERFEVTAELQRPGNLVPGGLTKPDLRAAVNAVDTWLNDNAAALNSAIPQPARGALSTAQKAALLAYVTTRRWGAG